MTFARRLIVSAVLLAVHGGAFGQDKKDEKPPAEKPEVVKVGDVKAKAPEKPPPMNKEELEKQLRRQFGANVKVVIGDIDVDQLSPQLPPEPIRLVGRVKVQGKRILDPTKTVVDKDELTNPADRNVLDVLRRQPEVNVTGSGVSLLGMPAGETQILVDGRRPGPNFSLGQVEPSQVERIEISSSTDAAVASMGMGGSVNIVLKDRFEKRKRSVSAGVGGGPSGDNANISLSYENADPKLGSYSVRGSHSYNGYENKNSSVERWTDRANNRSGSDRREMRSSGEFNMTRMSGRWNHQLPDDSWVTWNLDLGSNDRPSRNQSRQSLDGGAWHDYSSSDGTSGNRYFEPRITYRKDFTSALSLDSSYSHYVDKSKMDSTIQLHEAGRVAGSRSTTDTTSDSLDADLSYKTDNNSSYQMGIALESRRWAGTSSIRGALDDPRPYERETVERRTEQAVFGKWNKTLSNSVGISAGARVTRLDLRPVRYTNTSVLHGIRDTIVAPTFNLNWADSNGGKWTAGLGRTFSVPSLRALNTYTTPSLTEINRPLAPLALGNPDLKVQFNNQATLGYRRIMGGGFSFGATGKYVRLENAIGSLYFEQDDVWYYRPINYDHAEVLAFGLSGKLLRKFGKERPVQVLLRQSVTRNWTRVPGLDVAGLMEYTPWTAMFGIDVQRGPIVWRGDLSYNSGNTTSLSRQLTSRNDRSTRFNGSVTWLPNRQWSLSGNLSVPVRNRYGYSREFIMDDYQAYSVSSGTTHPSLYFNAHYKF